MARKIRLSLPSIDQNKFLDDIGGSCLQPVKIDPGAQATGFQTHLLSAGRKLELGHLLTAEVEKLDHPALVFRDIGLD